MEIPPEGGCGSSLSMTLRQPIASSIIMVERSSRDSIERAVCLYLSGGRIVRVLNSSLLVVSVIAERHHLLQQSVKTESKVIDVFTWLDG